MVYKTLIAILLVSVYSLAYAGPRTASAFSVFESAAKLWNTCVDVSAQKYYKVNKNPETIANAAISSCTEEGEITHLAIADFLNSLDKNVGRDETDIQTEAQNNFMEFRNNIVNKVTKQYLDLQIKNNELEKESKHKPETTLMF